MDQSTPRNRLFSSGKEGFPARFARLPLKECDQKAGLLIYRFAWTGGCEHCSLFYSWAYAELRGLSIKSSPT